MAMEHDFDKTMNFDSSTAGASISRVIDPDAELKFQKIKTDLHRQILDAVDLSRLSRMSDEKLRQHLLSLANRVIESRPDIQIDRERLIRELMAESFGLGPLQQYMEDPQVSDILVNGPSEVYVERKGLLERTATVFANSDHLMQIIQRVVSRVGRRVDEQTPMVDARLEDGSRVNAIIPPLSLNGPILSIRRFGVTPIRIEDMLQFNSICPEMTQMLEAAIRGKINLMISGGTGSGKTTLLNCLSQYIPKGERIVTVEDSAELQIQRSHVVRLETRVPNSEGEGEITPRSLVRNSLRMRPDRIILGEVRGPEALDMLQAMNTGHEGSMTTIHANSGRDALSRLEVMVSMTGYEMPVSVIRRYVGSAITIIVHLARLQGGVRRVMSVSEIADYDADSYRLEEIFGFRQEGVDGNGCAKGSFYSTGYVPKFMDRLHERGIGLPENFFAKRSINQLD